jgi:putative endonuclease
MFFVYIVECSDKTLYCGYTNNLESRINEHNIGKNGAKYTKTRRPVRLVYSENFESKSSAMKKEYEIKQLSKIQKQELINSPML